MVNAFGDYARAPMLQLEPLDLYELLRDVAELYRGSNLRIRLDLADPAPMISGDAGRMRQLLHNLFKNALEAVRDNDDGELTVHSQWMLEAGDRFIDISFSDNVSLMLQPKRAVPASGWPSSRRLSRSITGRYVRGIPTSTTPVSNCDFTPKPDAFYRNVDSSTMNVV